MTHASILLFLVATACGETDSDVAVAPSDSGVDAESSIPPCAIPPQTEYLKTNRFIGACPVLDAPCAESPFSGSPYLTAAQIAPQAELVGVSRDLVLAEAQGPDGLPEPLVVKVPSTGQPQFSIVPFAKPPPAGARARDIDGHSVLLCKESECWIGAVGPDGLLEELSGAIPPIQVEAEGIVEWGMTEMICVYGNGLYCFDGEAWLDVVPANSGPRFHAASATSTSIWAAGDGGRVVLATTECWTELESGTTASLRALSADGSRELWAAVAGDSGTVAYLSLDETITCKVGDSTWTALLRTWGENWGYEVADSFDNQWLFQTGGASVQGKPAAGGQWCSSELGETVIDATSFDCGVVENHRAITAHALFAAPFCALD